MTSIDSSAAIATITPTPLHITKDITIPTKVCSLHLIKNHFKN